MITIKQIKVKELPHYINTSEFINSEYIPVTKARAISQSFNPNAEAEDIALLVAYNDSNEMIGYIGILPGLYYSHNSTTKVYWNSGWWVHPVKGKLASMPLFYSMMEIFGDKLVLADLTPLTTQILEKTGLFEFPFQTPGVTAYLRIPVKKTIQNKMSIFRKLHILVKSIDFIVNFLVLIYQFFWQFRLSIPEDITIKEINSIDLEVSEFINSITKETGTFRKQDELNWILQYPWLRNGEFDKDIEAKKFYFSSITEEFSNRCLKIYKNNLLIAFIFLTSREGNFKVPYIFSNIIEPEYLYNILLKFLLENKAVSFTTWQTDLQKIIQTRFSPFIIKNHIIKQAAYSVQLKTMLSGFKFQDGEGDMVFT
jgi:hypothetical protein